MKTFGGIAEIIAAESVELGTSDWVLVNQRRINAFADAMGDRQWIHADVDRAKTGPFGGSIAHGILTLSLLRSFFAQHYRMTTLAVIMTYWSARCDFLRRRPRTLA